MRKIKRIHGKHLEECLKQVKCSVKSCCCFNHTRDIIKLLRGNLSELDRLTRRKGKQTGKPGKSWWQWGVPGIMYHRHVVGDLKTVSVLNMCPNSFTAHHSVYDVSNFIAPLYRYGNCGSEITCPRSYR